MYRLADKVYIFVRVPRLLAISHCSLQYDLQELKSLAIEDIRSKLSTDNILKEVFSRFTSRRVGLTCDILMKHFNYFSGQVS